MWFRFPARQASTLLGNPQQRWPVTSDARFDNSGARAKLSQRVDVKRREGPMPTPIATPFAGPIAESPQLQPTGSECRVYTRHPCGLPSSCQPAATFGKDDLKWSATIDDISIGGVGLILNR